MEDIYMALIKCKECGRDVSNLASSCPNCGAPVISDDTNGIIHIKCNYINGSATRVKVYNYDTGELLVSIPQRSSTTLRIAKDTKVEINFLAVKSAIGTLEYQGIHSYEIGSRLVFNEVNQLTNNDMSDE